MDAVAELLYEYLRDIMYAPTQAKLDVSALPDDFKELGQGMKYLADCIAEVRSFAKSLARGDAYCAAPSPDNDLAAPLKSLQAMLRHLTWQTKQVAKGDYKQHVDYLGEFSVAFNSIARQLEQREISLISELERSRQKARFLEQANDLFEIVTHASAQWIIIAEKATGEWIFSNYPAMHILAVEDFIPQLKRWISECSSEPDVDLMSRVREIELADSGVAQILSATVRPILWRERPSLAFVLTDVSSEYSHLRELENTAYRDTLTRQYNRHFGMRTLEQWLSEKRIFTLSFVDIDNLKYVNDKYGHIEGDDYILSVTALLRGFSPDLLISRLGGDEFMLLAEGWTENRMTAHLEALRSRLLRRNADPDAKYLHSMSFGAVAVDAGNTLTASELMAVADSKMYEYQSRHKLEGLSSEEDAI